MDREHPQVLRLSRRKAVLPRKVLRRGAGRAPCAQDGDRRFDRKPGGRAGSCGGDEAGRGHPCAGAVEGVDESLLAA